MPTKFGFSAGRGDKGRFYFQISERRLPLRRGDRHLCGNVGYPCLCHWQSLATLRFPSMDTFMLAVGTTDCVGAASWATLWTSRSLTTVCMSITRLELYVVEAEIDGFTEYHFFAGYGQIANLEEGLVGNANSLDRLDFHNADILGNWQWLSLSRRCNQKIPLLDTNGLKAWDVLTELARLVNCAVGFETLRDGTDRFFFRTHDKVIGVLSEYESGSTTQSLEPTGTTGPIVLDDNSAFPIGGDILVVSKPGSPQEQIEPMRYGGKRGTRQLTNLERGEAIADFVPGAVPVQHDYPGQVYLIKKVVENTQSGGSIIDIQIDAQFEYLANVVGVRYGGEMPPIRDEDVYRCVW